jgi:hypothetical protein
MGHKDCQRGNEAQQVESIAPVNVPHAIPLGLVLQCATGMPADASKHL